MAAQAAQKPAKARRCKCGNAASGVSANGRPRTTCQECYKKKTKPRKAVDVVDAVDTTAAAAAAPSYTAPVENTTSAHALPPVTLCKCGKPASGISSNGRPGLTCQECYDKKKKPKKAVSAATTAATGSSRGPASGLICSCGKLAEGVTLKGLPRSTCQQCYDKKRRPKKDNTVGPSVAARSVAVPAESVLKSDAETKIVLCKCGNPASGKSSNGRPRITCQNCYDKKRRPKKEATIEPTSTTAPGAVGVDVSGVLAKVSTLNPRTSNNAVLCKCGNPASGISPNGRPRTTCQGCYEKKQKPGKEAKKAKTSDTPALQASPILNGDVIDPQLLSHGAAAIVTPEAGDLPLDTNASISKGAIVREVETADIPAPEEFFEPMEGVVSAKTPQHAVAAVSELNDIPMDADADTLASVTLPQVVDSLAPNDPSTLMKDGIISDNSPKVDIAMLEPTDIPLDTNTNSSISESAILPPNASDSDVTHPESLSTPMEDVISSYTPPQTTVSTPERTDCHLDTNTNASESTALQAEIPGVAASEPITASTPALEDTNEISAHCETPASSSSKPANENVTSTMTPASGNVSRLQFQSQAKSSTPSLPASVHTMQGEQEEQEEHTISAPPSPSSMLNREIDPSEIAELEQEIEGLHAKLAAQRSACCDITLDDASRRRAHNEIHRLRGEISVKMEELWELEPRRRSNPYGLYTKSQLVQDEEGVCPPTGSMGYGKKPIFVLPQVKHAPPSSWPDEDSDAGVSVLPTPSKKRGRGLDDEGDNRQAKKTVFRTQ